MLGLENSQPFSDSGKIKQVLEKTKKTKKKKKMALMREEVAMVVLKGNKARIYRGKKKTQPHEGKESKFLLSVCYSER